LQFDPATGLLSLPIWVTATTAAVLVVLAILAVARSGTLKTLFMLLIFGLVIYGGWMGWLMFERLGDNARVDERRAFDQRVAELTARATVPNSVLSCLDSAIEAIATGCEKVLFSSPENVTAAVAYVSARLALLIDGTDLAAHSEMNYDSALNALRRGLETDRFGFVAHAMAQLPNCLAQQCETLSILNDANLVRANMQEKPFEALVAKYSPQWNQPARPTATSETRPLGLAPPSPVSSRYDLPSSASIPPVSIMNTESAPANAAANSAPSASPAATPAPRRPPAVRAPVARAAAPAEPPPVPLAPAAATSSSAASSTPGAAPVR
jgi:hypothetical protein